MNNPSANWTDLEKYVYGEHKSSCMLEHGGYACTCGKQEAVEEYAALRVRVEAAERERDELFNIAVKAFDVIEEIGFVKMKDKAQALDHALANDLSDDLWDRINAAALAAKGAG